MRIPRRAPWAAAAGVAALLLLITTGTSAHEASGTREGRGDAGATQRLARQNESKQVDDSAKTTKTTKTAKKKVSIPPAPILREAYDELYAGPRSFVDDHHRDFTSECRNAALADDRISDDFFGEDDYATFLLGDVAAADRADGADPINAEFWSLPWQMQILFVWELCDAAYDPLTLRRTEPEDPETQECLAGLKMNNDRSDRGVELGFDVPRRGTGEYEEFERDVEGLCGSVYHLAVSFGYTDKPEAPTASPVAEPTASPTSAPSGSPSSTPTEQTSESPSGSISMSPTDALTDSPTESPMDVATEVPSGAPSAQPSETPSSGPTSEGETQEPSAAPTTSPSAAPSASASPSAMPSDEPSLTPSSSPSSDPAGDSVEEEEEEDEYDVQFTYLASFDDASITAASIPSSYVEDDLKAAAVSVLSDGGISVPQNAGRRLGLGHSNGKRRRLIVSLRSSEPVQHTNLEDVNCTAITRTATTATSSSSSCVAIYASVRVSASAGEETQDSANEQVWSPVQLSMRPMGDLFGDYVRGEGTSEFEEATFLGRGALSASGVRAVLGIPDPPSSSQPSEEEEPLSPPGNEQAEEQTPGAAIRSEEVQARSSALETGGIAAVSVSLCVLFVGGLFTYRYIRRRQDGDDQSTGSKSSGEEMIGTREVKGIDDLDSAEMGGGGGGGGPNGSLRISRGLMTTPPTTKARGGYSNVNDSNSSFDSSVNVLPSSGGLPGMGMSSSGGLGDISSSNDDMHSPPSFAPSSSSVDLSETTGGNTSTDNEASDPVRRAWSLAKIASAVGSATAKLPLSSGARSSSSAARVMSATAGMDPKDKHQQHHPPKLANIHGDSSSSGKEDARFAEVAGPDGSPLVQFSPASADSMALAATSTLESSSSEARTASSPTGASAVATPGSSVAVMTPGNGAAKGGGSSLGTGAFPFPSPLRSDGDDTASPGRSYMVDNTGGDGTPTSTQLGYMGALAKHGTMDEQSAMHHQYESSDVPSTSDAQSDIPSTSSEGDALPGLAAPATGGVLAAIGLKRSPHSSQSGSISSSKSGLLLREEPVVPPPMLPPQYRVGGASGGGTAYSGSYHTGMMGAGGNPDSSMEGGGSGSSSVERDVHEMRTQRIADLDAALDAGNWAAVLSIAGEMSSRDDSSTINSSSMMSQAGGGGGGSAGGVIVAGNLPSALGSFSSAMEGSESEADESAGPPRPRNAAAAAGKAPSPNEGGSVSGRSESSVSRRTDRSKLSEEDERRAKHLDDLIATGDWNLVEKTAAYYVASSGSELGSLSGGSSLGSRSRSARGSARGGGRAERGEFGSSRKSSKGRSFLDIVTGRNAPSSSTAAAAVMSGQHQLGGLHHGPSFDTTSEAPTQSELGMGSATGPIQEEPASSPSPARVAAAAKPAPQDAPMGRGAAAAAAVGATAATAAFLRRNDASSHSSQTSSSSSEDESMDRPILAAGTLRSSTASDDGDGDQSPDSDSRGSTPPLPVPAGQAPFTSPDSSHATNYHGTGYLTAADFQSPDRSQAGFTAALSSSAQRSAGRMTTPPPKGTDRGGGDGDGDDDHSEKSSPMDWAVKASMEALQRTSDGEEGSDKEAKRTAEKMEDSKETSSAVPPGTAAAAAGGAAGASAQAAAAAAAAAKRDGTRGGSKRRKFGFGGSKKYASSNDLDTEDEDHRHHRPSVTSKPSFLKKLGFSRRSAGGIGAGGGGQISPRKASKAAAASLALQEDSSVSSWSAGSKAAGGAAGAHLRHSSYDVSMDSSQDVSSSMNTTQEDGSALPVDLQSVRSSVPSSLANPDESSDMEYATGDVGTQPMSAAASGEFPIPAPPPTSAVSGRRTSQSPQRGPNLLPPPDAGSGSSSDGADEELMMQDGDDDADNRSLRDELDMAIERGDWAAVERQAAEMLDQSSVVTGTSASEDNHDDGRSFSTTADEDELVPGSASVSLASSSQRSTPSRRSGSARSRQSHRSSKTGSSTVDEERIAQLERLIEMDDWQGIVSTAGKFRVEDTTSSGKSDGEGYEEYNFKDGSGGSGGGTEGGGSRTFTTSPTSDTIEHARGGVYAEGVGGYETPRSHATDTTSSDGGGDGIAYHDASPETGDGSSNVSAAVMAAQAQSSVAKSLRGERNYIVGDIENIPEEEREALQLAEMWEGIAQKAEATRKKAGRAGGGIDGIDTSFDGNGIGRERTRASEGAGIAAEWAIDQSYKSMTSDSQGPGSGTEMSAGMSMSASSPDTDRKRELGLSFSADEV